MSRFRNTVLLLLAAGVATSAQAAVNFNVTYVDGAGEGFNDATLGTQRRTAFEFALNHFGTLIDGTVTVQVQAQFDPLGGSANSATLGFAGPVTASQNFTNAPVANTFFVSSIANQLAGTDLSPANHDIAATFNSDVDGTVVLGNTVWYYGTDANGPANTVDFVSTALHELGHGLGFLSLMNQDGSYSTSNPDIYTRLLVLGNNVTTPTLPDLTQAQRGTAQTSGNLFSSGPLTRLSGAGLNARIFAPNPFQAGSSTSHLDEATFPGSNEMMTPIASATTHEFGPVARSMMADFGYVMTPEWANAAGGSFNALANWNVREQPGPGDALTIALAGTYTVTANGGSTFRSLALGAGSGTQTLAIGGQSLTATSTVDVAANGRITMAGGNLAATSGTTIAGGLTATGTVAGAVNNNGFVAPGQSPGTLTINGNYAQGAAGALNIEVGGLTAGTQHDQVVVNGNATLAGTLNVSLVNGFIPANGNTFTILTGTAVTGNFTTNNLPALAGGLTWQVNVGATSVQLVIVPGGGGGAATQLGFVTQPSNTGAGAAITPSVQVAVQDAGGATVTTATNAVTIAIGNNPGGGTLSGTETVNAVAGIATFPGVSINAVGTGYTLTAAATGLTSATSNAFNITVGGAAGLAFRIQPTNASAGATITPAVRVAVIDAGGNTVTGSTASITLAFGSSPQGAVLGGTTTVAAVAGEATFSDLSIAMAGTGYTLVASATGLGTVTSSTFDISAGTATALQFQQQPTNTVAGSPITPPVQLRAVDAQGNTATSFTGAVTLALAVGPPNATLSGTLAVNAVAGVASFNDLSLNRAVTGYQLVANATGLTGAFSSLFDIAPGQVHAGTSRVDATPTSAPSDGTTPVTITVTVLDVNNNPLQGLAGNLVNIAANPATGVTITQPAAATDANGRTTATAVSTAGGVITFSATASGVAITDTAQVTFSAPAIDPARCQVSIAPSTIAANGTQQAVLTVTLRDANGSPVGGSQPGTRTLAVAATSGDANSVTLANPGAATGADGRFQAVVTAATPGVFTLTVAISGDSLPSVMLTVRPQFSTTFAPGLRFFGLPFRFDDPRPLNVLGNTGYSLARFDPDTQSYVRFTAAQDASAAFAMGQGRGFWARFDTNVVASGLGDPVANTLVDLPLQAGFNALANPFTTALPWDLTRLEAVVNGNARSLADPATWSIVQPYCFIFDGQYQLVFDSRVPGLQATANAVPAMSGFFFLANQAGVLLRIQPPAGSSRSTSEAPPSPNNWTASLTASSASGASSAVVLGVSAGLSRELAFARPPEPVPTDIELSLVANGTRSLGALRTTMSDGVWPLEAVSRQAGDVTLSWPGLLRQLPRGVVLELTDEVSGSRVLLNTHGSYRYTASQADETRRFTLRSRLGTITRSEIQSLAVTAGRGEGTIVALQLSGPADVTVTVRGLGGRLVRSISESADAAGPLSVVWDGNDDQGRRVPAGTYQVEAVAVSDNGAVSRATRTVTLR